LEGFGSNNLTKVIMEALTIRGGMFRDQVASKLMSFGGDNVNVFLAKRIMAKFITLLLKMTMDNSTNQQAKLNFKHLCDL
jgi:hypothetical protein